MNQIVHIKNVKQNNLTLTPNFKNQPCENDNSSFLVNFFRFGSIKTKESFKINNQLIKADFL